MAEIFIYSSISLREARGNLEDDLEEFHGSTFEVTGGGGGERGWNIDLEVSDDNLANSVEKLQEYLSGWGVPPDTDFDVYVMRNGAEEETRYDVFDTSTVVTWINTALVYLSERLASNPLAWQALKQEIEAKLSELDSVKAQSRD